MGLLEGFIGSVELEFWLLIGIGKGCFLWRWWIDGFSEDGI